MRVAMTLPQAGVAIRPGKQAVPISLLPYRERWSGFGAAFRGDHALDGTGTFRESGYILEHSFFAMSLDPLRRRGHRTR